MKHAFSLVELSIVLVILGLLTGGILTGQNLIRAAELRSVTTEFSAYQTAVNTFKDKYFAIPGDMRNATDFWGQMTTGTCPNATGGTGTQTCNGDGDGQILTSGAANQANETFLFWQHLANAGLIEGTYSGIAGSVGNYDGDVGVNVPRAKIANAGWSASTKNYMNTCGANGYTGQAGNNETSFRLGSDNAGFMSGAVFTTEEAWNIDTKIDDGVPGRGKLSGHCAADCSTVLDYATAEYALSSTAMACFLEIKF